MMGVLERTERGYMFSSNLENEQKIKDVGILTSHDYSLWHSIKRENKKLFPEFVQIINNCRRADIIKAASITPQDSMWDKLVKLSRLSWYTPNFYVQPAEDFE